MIIILHRRFEKRYRLLRLAEKRKFKERRDLFLADQFHPLLNNHPLAGKYDGYRGFNVGGDLRVIFKQLDRDTVVFVEIGPHDRLYG
ncbi:MAG: type II toxin-antitoxin system YafQ family toxin [bacterium]|nr:type II toxin-antitoxin system YafQ family toxin [bacterium]